MIKSKASIREADDFAAMVRGDHADVQSFRRFVLARLRAARLMAKGLIQEIDAIGIALHSNFIDAETALQWMSELNALELMDAGENQEQSAGDSDRVPDCDVLSDQHLAVLVGRDSGV